MATLVLVGSCETRLVARPGGAPFVYTPTPERRRNERAIRATASSTVVADPASPGTTQQDDRQVKRPRRLELGLGRGAAAVLGDQHVDAVLAHQTDFVGELERTTRLDVGRMFENVLVDGLDRADEDNDAAVRSRRLPVADDRR